jgi:hypothetical protein
VRRDFPTDTEAANALAYGGHKSSIVPFHRSLANDPDVTGVDPDDPDPNGTWDDEDWYEYDQRN